MTKLVTTIHSAVLGNLFSNRRHGLTVNPQRLHPSSQTTAQNKLHRLSGVIDAATKMPTPESNSVQTVALASLASGTSFPVWSQIWQERNERDKDYYAQLDLAL